ncbi:Serine/threonine phosphatase stp [Candidatus Rubidus massiliensis]|nr:Serine/threonine phosphatase stp [Candidatus Rubidus massiliensis]
MVIRIKMPYSIISYGLSDIGLVRQKNEDYWAEIQPLHFYILADGMGGHLGGEVAAKEAVKTVVGFIQKVFAKKDFSVEEAQGIIHYAFEYANKVVYEKGCENYSLKGMGTTLCCAFFYKKSVIIASVGDSRIYRLRDNQFEQLTKDHSLLREMLDKGQLDEDQATEFLYKNIITKAIGTEVAIEPFLYSEECQVGDILLLCSDGLTDMLSNEEIQKILQQLKPELAAKKLIALAKKRGGYDNITVIVLQVQESL